MSIGGGVVGGVVGGVIGAGIWAGISYFTGIEIGWVAWGVGGLVGLGCSWGSRGGGAVLGCMAVVITLLAIAGGKYAAVHLMIRNEVGSEQEFLQSTLATLQDDEVVVSYMADEIIEAMEVQGQTIEWPAGTDPNEASGESDYPPAVWSQASTRWEQMSAQERDEYREQLAGQIRVGVRAFFSDVSSRGFLASFGAMDLLFFALAVVTAFRIAARGLAPAAETDTPANTE